MNIAILHYHLKTGGVTTVIKQHINAVKDDCEFLVLTGPEPETPFPAETTYIRGLGYDKDNDENFEPHAVAEAVIRAIHTKWPEGCDVIHIHNPTLAKNKNFIKILNILKQDHNLFLQIHDFAEDGRPTVYFKEDYPSDCHYGVINSRDYKYLLASGLKESGLHIIPNTVSPIKNITQPENIEPRILYPVRAIRRKNIGEAILLSLFTGENQIAITQPPNSITDFIPYNAWKNFVELNRINIIFEAGLKSDFELLTASSKFMISTSITEGFGFSFLEPWLSGKLLIGRKLSSICTDFENNAIKLDHLYSNLFIPLDLINNDELYNLWSSCIFKNCRRFCFSIDKDTVDSAFEKITQNKSIDFGLLNESFQKEVILCLLSDSSLKKNLINLNPFLADPGNIHDKEHLIEHNNNSIRRNYINDDMKDRLLEIYNTVKTDVVNQTINKERLFEKFLNLDKFSLLKWGEYKA